MKILGKSKVKKVYIKFVFKLLLNVWFMHELNVYMYI